MSLRGARIKLSNPYFRIEITFLTTNFQHGWVGCSWPPALPKIPALAPQPELSQRHMGQEELGDLNPGKDLQKETAA